MRECAIVTLGGHQRWASGVRAGGFPATTAPSSLDGSKLAGREERRTQTSRPAARGGARERESHARDRGRVGGRQDGAAPVHRRARRRTSGLERAVGVASEMELAFAALHQLCAPMLERLDRLPEPQRAALAIALGLSAGATSGIVFCVGLAVLRLLSEAAAERPLLCVVDDAQWLDRASAQTLAFVARRVSVESVGILFATRHLSEELKRLPTLSLAGLDTKAARELLLSIMSSPLDERVRERIIAETRGNPLALLELPRGLRPIQLAGGFGLLAAPPARAHRANLRSTRGACSLTTRGAYCWSQRPNRLAIRCCSWRTCERLGISVSTLDWRSKRAARGGKSA